MSFYLYGEFCFNRTLSPGEQESLAFDLSEAALRARIYVRLGLNIVEREVFETLKRSDGGLSPDSMAFLVTDSPLSNTSDEILEPHYVMPLDMDRVIRERLRRVEAFLKSAKGMNIKGLSLYTDTWSGGYDVPRREEEVELGFLVNRMLDLYTELHHIPNCRFEIVF